MREQRRKEKKNGSTNPKCFDHFKQLKARAHKQMTWTKTSPAVMNSQPPTRGARTVRHSEYISVRIMIKKNKTKTHLHLIIKIENAVILGTVKKQNKKQKQNKTQ